MRPTPTLVLASASPRRRELVERLGLEFELMPADIDETRREGETPCELVARLACGKAHACRETLGIVTQTVILAADTIVWMDDGRVMGKPTDPGQARMTLERLSGRTHHVSTGVCILDLTGNASEGLGAERVFVETTDVSFRRITSAEIAAYVRGGEPLDKAGSYGIQGLGCLFVKSICGDYDNIVGLPIFRVVQELNGIWSRGKDVTLTEMLLEGGSCNNA